MADEEHLYKGQKIKFKGNIDLDRMYNKIIEWLEDEDFEVNEDFYTEKIKPYGKDIEIGWTCTQSKHPYIDWKAKLEIYSIGSNEVEVEQDGKKLKMNKCTTQVKIDAWQIINPKDEYKGFIKKFYEKFIMEEKIEEERGELFKIMQELASEFKIFLALYEA